MPLTVTEERSALEPKLIDVAAWKASTMVGVFSKLNVPCEEERVFPPKLSVPAICAFPFSSRLNLVSPELSKLSSPRVRDDVG